MVITFLIIEEYDLNIACYLLTWYSELTVIAVVNTGS